jgi:hypothetical protein
VRDFGDGTLAALRGLGVEEVQVEGMSLEDIFVAFVGGERA